MNGRTNVVIVIVDALRADRVGKVVGGHSLTPNIDAIAEEGTTFRNAYACSSNTDPAITSLETGWYPLNTVFHHGRLVTHEEKQRVESISPLSVLLSREGWETIAVGQSLGRWHSRGFDHYPGTTEGERLRSKTMEFARRTVDVIDDVSPRSGALIRSLYNVSNRGMKPATVMQDYDPTTLLSRVRSPPFFGFIHLMETHMPYLGTTEDFNELLSQGEYPDQSLPELADRNSLTDAQVRRVEDAIDSLNLNRPSELFALYDAAVRYADRKIGRLVSALREHGHWEDTLLFITADHGESLLEHGIFLDHHGLYDQVMRVPLVSNLGRGSEVDEFVQTMDIAPTVLDLLDQPIPQMDGQSLRPLIDDVGAWDERIEVLAEEAYTERRRAVRTDRWKYIRHLPDETIEAERGSSLRCGYCDTVHGSERELYDLRQDPEERDNLADDLPDVVERLESLFENRRNLFIEPLATGGEVGYEHEEAVLDRLEAIGYK